MRKRKRLLIKRIRGWGELYLLLNPIKIALVFLAEQLWNIENPIYAVIGFKANTLICSLNLQTNVPRNSYNPLGVKPKGGILPRVGFDSSRRQSLQVSQLRVVHHRQSRTAHSHKNICPPGFPGYRSTVVKTSRIFSQDEINEQPHGSTWTCKCWF